MVAFLLDLLAFQVNFQHFINKYTLKSTPSPQAKALWLGLNLGGSLSTKVSDLA